MTECNAETSATDITQCDVHIPVDSIGSQGTPTATVSDPATLWRLSTELGTGTGTPVVVHTELPVVGVASAAFGGALVGVLIAVAVAAVVLRRRGAQQHVDAVTLPEGGDDTSPVTTDSDQPSPKEEA